MGNPYRVVCTTKDRAKWLAQHANYTTASAMPTILGMQHGSWSSRFSLFEKMVSGYKDDDGENERAEWGHLHEPTMRGVFAKRTGQKVRATNRFLASREFPWIAATEDGMTWDELGNPGTLELKCTSMYESAWREGEIPDYVMAQIQTQMLVRFGRSRGLGNLAVLFFGNDFHHVTGIEPHAVLQEHLIRESKMFYDLVVAGSPPEPDASDACRKAIGKLYPSPSASTINLAGERWISLDCERVEIEIRQKADRKRRQEIENEIRAEIGENTSAELDNGVRYDYRAGKRGRTLTRKAPK